MPRVLSRRARVTGVALALLFVSLVAGRAQQTAAPARPGVGSALFSAVDTNKDAAVLRAEMQSAFAAWYGDWDRGKSGALTEAAIAAGLAAVLPASPAAADRAGAGAPTPNETDVQEMLKVLPSAAPAKPARPRRVLVLADSPGFTHSSIPLAARMVEELGRNTVAWSTTVSYDPNVITSENLKQYDAIVLDSTVGAFLDEAGDQTATAARRTAVLAFVRGGKGLVGIHAATDTYHSGMGNTPFTRAAPMPAQLAAALVSQGDKDGDQKLTVVELRTLIDVWFDAIDPAKTDRVGEAAFAERLAVLAPPRGGRAGAGRGGRGTEVVGRGSAPAGGTWPEFNQMIGGIFKNHPWQRVTVKIDDPQSPLTSMFKTRSFEFEDETYSFFQDSWSRANVHVLMSIDYAKMSDADKALESSASARTDGDYGLSWIRREGSGRVFYLALGHRE
ncbi:MAG TPA: ThuA domain-containing protein, partial [Vicinamibacterales bacterium]|nr:ThuA domain-containing protein [Vicinamibacterales bacterium]